MRANTVDARSVYVVISRASKGAAIYTNNCASLDEALGINDGEQVEGIDKTVKVPDVATAIPHPSGPQG